MARDADVVRKVAHRAIDSQANLLDRGQKIVHRALGQPARVLPTGTAEYFDETVDFVYSLEPRLKREFAQKLREKT